MPGVLNLKEVTPHGGEHMIPEAFIVWERPVGDLSGSTHNDV